jgi:hypothetical protein
MKVPRLIILASPALVASMLLLGKPAEASIVKSAPAQPHLALASDQPVSQSVTPNSSQESNPITDQMGCKCATCVQARLELQGKLPISNHL